MTRYVDPKIIQRELKKLVKNTNFYYSKAKESRIKDRKQLGEISNSPETA